MQSKKAYSSKMCTLNLKSHYVSNNTIYLFNIAFASLESLYLSNTGTTIPNIPNIFKQSIGLRIFPHCK